MVSQAAQELSNILQNYQIGDLVNYKQDERGYNNTNFAVETELQGKRQKYFFRRYKTEIKEEELRFEHSIINHLVERNFDLVARLIKTRTGESYVHLRENGEAEDGVFYAIFEFLLGDDKYTWINPTCTEEEIKNAARVLGEFHNAVFDFTPQGQRYEPEIVDLLPQISSNVVRCLDRDKHTVVDACLLENSELIQNAIHQAHAALNEHACRDWVRLVNHCDFHPGNLKFSGEQIVGLCDFDWSKIDFRSFDVGLAIFYFFTDWRGERDGELHLDRLPLFLKSYQDALKDLPGVGPFAKTELLCLPAMISAGNLFVLNWTIMDYIHNQVDPDEYLIYLKHSVNLIKWLDDRKNRSELEKQLVSLEI